MAEYTYEQLKHKTIGDLREIARGLDHEAVQGFSQLNKEHLLPGLCKAWGSTPTSTTTWSAGSTRTAPRRRCGP